MTDLRSCCQQALLDGETPEGHFPWCDARAEDPPTPPLIDLNDLAEKGNRHA